MGAALSLRSESIAGLGTIVARYCHPTGFRAPRLCLCLSRGLRHRNFQFGYSSHFARMLYAALASLADETPFSHVTDDD